jgi:Fe-S cluster biogenesis protein NfuA
MQPKYNTEQLYKKHINIYTEASPNPNSMKFVLNTMLSHDENLSKDYPDAVSAAESPLANQIFQFPFVRRVFMTKNFITITKDEQISWDDIIGGMKVFLKDYFENNKPVFEVDDNDPDHDRHRPKIEFNDGINENDSETVKTIKGILEEYIRPAVESDGGMIRFHSFEEESGIVKVLLQGSCSGCPSSKVTLKAGIENLLKRMLPNAVKEVVAEGI